MICGNQLTESSFACSNLPPARMLLLALRQQVTVPKRKRPRPSLNWHELLLPHGEVVVTDVHRRLMVGDSLQREFVLARGQGACRHVERNSVARVGSVSRKIASGQDFFSAAGAKLSTSVAACWTGPDWGAGVPVSAERSAPSTSCAQ